MSKLIYKSHEVFSLYLRLIATGQYRNDLCSPEDIADKISLPVEISFKLNTVLVVSNDWRNAQSVVIVHIVIAQGFVII